MSLEFDATRGNQVNLINQAQLLFSIIENLKVYEISYNVLDSQYITVIKKNLKDAGTDMAALDPDKQATKEEMEDRFQKAIACLCFMSGHAHLIKFENLYGADSAGNPYYKDTNTKIIGSLISNIIVLFEQAANYSHEELINNIKERFRDASSESTPVALLASIVPIAPEIIENRIQKVEATIATHLLEILEDCVSFLTNNTNQTPDQEEQPPTLG